MQHRLFLLRHAKSSWDDPTLDDHDRPLARRGEKAVRRMRGHLARTGVAPELVLCSSARRTIETLDGVRPALPDRVEISIEEGLYAASAGRLLDRLRQVADDVSGVLLIAHNPGLEDLAGRLVATGDRELRDRLEASFPTGALVSLSFEGEWADLGPGVAELDGYVVPRELE
jgi:phosphohistidine phosphatase